MRPIIKVNLRKGDTDAVTAFLDRLSELSSTAAGLGDKEARSLYEKCLPPDTVKEITVGVEGILDGRPRFVQVRADPCRSCSAAKVNWSSGSIMTIRIFLIT